MKKERIYTDDVNEFMDYIKENHADYIKRHQRHNEDTPIVYEICNNRITVSYINDITLTFGNSQLQEIMTTIAYVTNNMLRCGAVFTIG